MSLSRFIRKIRKIRQRRYGVSVCAGVDVRGDGPVIRPAVPSFSAVFEIHERVVDRRRSLFFVGRILRRAIQRLIVR